MFYRCYDKDAYIVSYLLGYKLNSNSANDMAGFPSSSIKDVTNKLILNNVDYKIIKVNKLSLEIIDNFSARNDNNYETIYEKSCIYTKLKNKINRLSQKLVEKIGNDNIDEVLNKIENIIFENLR